MKLSEILAESLNEIRQDEGLGLTDLADKMDISRSSLQTYLKARGNPQVGTIDLIAERMEMPVARLIFGKTACKEVIEMLSEEEEEFLLGWLLARYLKRVNCNLDKEVIALQEKVLSALGEFLKAKRMRMEEAAGEQPAAKAEEK